MEEYKRFTISLPPQLYEELEVFRNKLGISRSDFIRKAIHSFMISEDNFEIESGNVVGCITLIMAHEHFKSEQEEHNDHDHPHEVNHDQNHSHDHKYGSRPIYANIQQSDQLLKNDIQHHFYDIIISTMHVHLEFEKCLEILAVSGPFDRVKELKDDLQRLKSIISIGFFIIDRESTLNIDE